ncbi:MAG TPA: SGNH/GDSL hydrolase family protein [Acidimicrobiales bacterium]|jgi:lysophospholipase L1-like esterase
MRLVVAPLALAALAACSSGAASSGDAHPASSTTARPSSASGSTTAPARSANGLAPYIGHGSKVVLVGDSLANGAEADTRRQLSSVAVAWNSYPGTTWPDWTARAASIAAMHPALVVVELGTNDLWDGWQDHDRTDLDALLAAVGAVPCLALVNYASHGHVVDITDSPNPAYVPGEAIANRVLGQVASTRTAAGHPTVVADWSQAAAGHAAWFDWDGVHFTAAGNRGWADWLAGIVHRITTTDRCRTG